MANYLRKGGLKAMKRKKGTIATKIGSDYMSEVVETLIRGGIHLLIIVETKGRKERVLGV